jgi:TolB-like protein/Tfp pilus assembly protein PilF
MSLLTELKRRKVIRVGIAYAIGAWLVLQLAEVLSELLNLPESVGPVVVIVVALGFPVVLVLAWVYELTADGLKRDADVAPEARSSGRLLNITVVVLLVLALGYFVWESRFRDDSERSARTGQQVSNQADRLEIGRSIAVLPFEDFSDEGKNTYFADGLSDTLLHKLAQIRNLKVIARNSSFQFKGSNKDVREIGELLGVDTILEGSVQRSGDQVRVIAQLVRTSDGTHVWSQSFDDTADNILDLQDRIAVSIVDQFQLSLSRADRERMLRNSTYSPEAYDLVIRALNEPADKDDLPSSEAVDNKAIQLLKEALELDPNYALAWAYLSFEYNTLAFSADSAADFNLFVAESTAAANKAIELDPGLPQPHSALGWVAHRNGNGIEASRHFRKALELDPNALDAMSGLALQLGVSDPEEALSLLERSLELDPTSAIVYRQKHFILLALNRQQEALQSIEKAIQLSPSRGMFYNDIADLLERMGRPDEGAQYGSRLLTMEPESFIGQVTMAEAWLAAADFQQAGNWISLMLESRSDSQVANLVEVERLLASGQYQEALDLLDTVPESNETRYQFGVRRLAACLGLHQPECAVQQASLFQKELRDMMLKAGGLPPDFEFYATVGQMLADEQANPDYDSAETARRLLEFPTANGSQFFGPVFYTRAGLHARAGDLTGAVALLEQMLVSDTEAIFNIDLFSFDVERSPMLTPLRDQPEFQDWLQRYRERRKAMLDRMQTMEVRGEILPVASLRPLLN